MKNIVNFKKNRMLKALGRKNYKGVPILSKRFDCDWKMAAGIEKAGTQNACEKCKICRYLNFLEMAQSVGLPPGSIIEHDEFLEKYLKLCREHSGNSINIS